MQDSKRKISAKKQLKQDLRGFDASSEKKGFFGDLSSRMEQIKNMENEQKREYKNIDDDEIIPLTLASQYIPIRDIKGGIIETTDNRFLKIVELEPVNYNLKSESEKKRIINAFEDYLKIAPKKMQIKCMCHEATVNDIVQKINNNKVSEQYDNVRDIYEDSIRFVRSLAATDAITKRFFIVFQYEPEAKYLEKSFEHAKKYLYDVVETATKYLKVCGNLIYDTEEHPNHNQARYIYEILNRKKAFTMPFEYSVSLLENRWMEKNG